MNVLVLKTNPVIIMQLMFIQILLIFWGGIQDKAGPHKEIYPYVIQELRPTLNELGIPTPEELGIDKA